LDPPDRGRRADWFGATVGVLFFLAASVALAQSPTPTASPSATPIATLNDVADALRLVNQLLCVTVGFIAASIASRFIRP
jgi:hypothetical protein